MVEDAICGKALACMEIAGLKATHQAEDCSFGSYVLKKQKGHHFTV